MAANRIKGITIEIGGDTTKLQTALKGVNTEGRNASFNSMSLDEELAEIANLIENLLKKNGRYVEPDYSKICFEYISDDGVKSFRKKLHCFRHSSDESISEREAYSEDQKNFMIDYGLTIIKVIYSLVQ